NLAARDPAGNLDIVGLGARDRVPERLLGRADLRRCGQEMMGLLLREVKTCLLLVERAALRRDQIPAAEIGRAGTTQRLPTGQRDAVDEIVLDLVDPDPLEVRRDTETRKREPQKIDEATIFQLALDAAAPILRRTQRIAAQRLDAFAIPGLEVDE